MIFVRRNNGSSSYPYVLPSEYTGFYPIQLQGRRQLPRSGGAEGASLRGDPPPEIFWNLDGKSCTLGDSLYKIINRNFFSSALDVPRGPTFWEVGTAMAVPAVQVAPALSYEY